MPFSAAAQKELRKCLGSQGDAVLPELRKIIGAFPAAQDALANRRKWHDPFLIALVDFQEALAAARRALDAVEDGVPASVPEMFNITAFDGTKSRKTLDRLEREMIAETSRYRNIRTTSYWAAEQKRGRRRDEPRQWLANRVAHVLQQHGIRLKKGHNNVGTFPRVLGRVVEVAESVAIVSELFPAVLRTVNLFDKRAALLKELSEDAIGYARLPRRDPDKVVRLPSGEQLTHFIYFAVPVNGAVVKFTVTPRRRR
jgi:hypothetical protein